jgi:hypothetical protein
MRRRWLTGSLLLLVPACGDSGVDTDSASGSQTDTALTSGGSDTPTGDPVVTTSDSGSASMSASGTTTAPTTTDPTVTTGPDSLSITGDTDATTAQATGDTTDTTDTTDTSTTTDTGVGMFCVAPEDTPEDVALNEACDIELQIGTFNPVIEWKYGSTAFFGPPVAGRSSTPTARAARREGHAARPPLRGHQRDRAAGRRQRGRVAETGPYGGYGNGLALGDLEGDGWPEIVTAGPPASARSTADGAEKWCVPGGAARHVANNRL